MRRLTALAAVAAILFLFLGTGTEARGDSASASDTASARTIKNTTTPVPNTAPVEADEDNAVPVPNTAPVEAGEDNAVPVPETDYNNGEFVPVPGSFLLIPPEGPPVEVTIKITGEAEHDILYNSESMPRLESKWKWKLLRDGKVVDEWESTNIVVKQGIAHMLDCMFNGANQVASWYIGLFTNDYTPAVTETYQNNDFDETDAYSEGARVLYQSASASGTTEITNSANTADFSISGSTTIYGAFASTNNTIGDTSSGETLYNISKFGSGRSVESGDTLQVTVTLSLDN